jgi:hypothetical protein
VLLWDISTPIWRSIFEFQGKCSYEIVLLHYEGPFLKTRESAPMSYFYSTMTVHFWNSEKVLRWDICTPLLRSIFDNQRMCSYELFLLHYDGPFLKFKESAPMRYLYSTIAVHFLNTEQVLLWNISTPLWRSIFENQWKCSYDIFLFHYDGPFLKSIKSVLMRYFYSNMAVHFWYPENVLLWDLIHYDGPF